MMLPPLSLYIHTPWCIKKCPYCDFNSHTFEVLPEEAYLKALLQDLTFDQPFIQGRLIESIFIGGGTPSVMSGDFYQKLFTALSNKVRYADNIEITLEANPGTIEAQKFKAYFQAGINRLSIGVQSFNDHQLKTLGRIHSASEAKKAIVTANEAGFNNFNLDLMYALPKQNEEEALADLNTALDFNPTHLSWYQLTIEPNTYFHRYPPKQLPEEECVFDIEQKGRALLAQHGLNRYEVSAYAKANSASKHNLNYWTFGDYIGIGAGAHSKITLPDEKKIIRFSKTRMPKDYLNTAHKLIIEHKNPFSGVIETVQQDDIAGEFFMNALRLQEGVSLNFFEEYTGISVDTVQDKIEVMIKKGLIQLENNHIKTTQRGYDLLNSVVSSFFDHA